MYIYNIDVKWSNGDLEGFGASGLTKEMALKRAKAYQKASGFNIGFNILTQLQYKALSIREQDEIQIDWDNSSI